MRTDLSNFYAEKAKKIKNGVQELSPNVQIKSVKRRVLRRKKHTFENGYEIEIVTDRETGGGFIFSTSSYATKEVIQKTSDYIKKHLTN